MGRDENTRPVPFSMGIPVPLTAMIVLGIILRRHDVHTSSGTGVRSSPHTDGIVVHRVTFESLY